MARIHHVHEDVGFGQLLERRFERRYELVGQLLDEADRVGEHERRVRRDRDQASSGVQRHEEPIGGGQRGTGQPIQQRGLAGIRVTHERDDGHAARASAVTEQPPMHAHPPELLADLPDAVPDEPTIRLDLLLTRTASPDTTAQTLEVLPLTDEARQEIGELGELHLELALHRSRALREDVEDQRGAVDDAHPDRAAEVAPLDPRKRVVGDHQAGPLPLRQRLDLLDLALAEVETGCRRPSLLGDATDDRRARRFGEALELVEGLLDLEAALRGQSKRREESLFPRFQSISPSWVTCFKIRSAAPSTPPARSTSIQRISGSRENHVIWRLA